MTWRTRALPFLAAALAVWPAAPAGQQDPPSRPTLAAQASVVAHQRVVSAPFLLASGRHDVSPALRDIPPRQLAVEREPHEPLLLRGPRQQRVRQPDPALQTSAPSAFVPARSSTSKASAMSTASCRRTPTATSGPITTCSGSTCRLPSGTRRHAALRPGPRQHAVGRLRRDLRVEQRRRPDCPLRPSRRPLDDEPVRGPTTFRRSFRPSPVHCHLAERDPTGA